MQLFRILCHSSVGLILAATLAGCATGVREDQIDSEIGRLQGAMLALEAPRGCTPGEAWRYPGFELANHVVVSGSDGHLISHDGSVRAASDRVIDNVVAWSRTRPGKPARLLFYFNGGLNARETVLSQAARQVPCMLADGVYPVFMIWDTDGARSYGEQAFYLRNGLIQERQIATGAIYVLGDVVEGIGRAPSDYVVHGKRYWNKLLTLRPCSDLLLPAGTEAGGCSPAHRLRFVGPGDPIEAGRNVLIDQARVDGEVPYDLEREVRYGMFWPVRLGTTPFVDGLGASGWSNFIRRTRTTIRKPVELDLDRTTRCPRNLEEDRQQFPEGTGSFSKLFKLLSFADRGERMPVGTLKCGKTGDEDETEPPTDPAELAAFKALNLSIIMVGHSMGAIAINELVQRYRDLPYRDIVYMAAAASILDTRRAIEPLLLQHQDLRFYNLMLHPLNDAGERSYAGAVPSGSLLMYIDEMYEPAKTPEDRTFGYWPNAKGARAIFNREAAAHMLYRVFSRPIAGPQPCASLACAPFNPVRHGDFNDDEMCFWRPAFWGATATVWRSRYTDLPTAACGYPGR